MLGELSYLSYTFFFTLPLLMMLWVRREFRVVLRRNIKAVFFATLLLTVYGSIVWALALEWGAWDYHMDKLTGIVLPGGLLFEDVLWWFLVSFLISSFVVLARYHEEKGIDVVWKSIRELVKSFRDAFAGLYALTLERNFAVHIGLGVAVVIMGIVADLMVWEWLFVAVAIALVLGAELFNHAIERLATIVSAEHNEDIRFIKDVAAAGVLIIALGAIAVGALVFLPRLIALFD